MISSARCLDVNEAFQNRLNVKAKDDDAEASKKEKEDFRGAHVLDGIAGSRET